MGLTSIPTETDGSLGRDKVDIAAPPNLDQYVPNAEYNNLKKAVAEMAAALGLADGTTDYSLEQLRRALNDPAKSLPGTMVVIDDFYFIDSDVWTKTETGTGSVNVIEGDGDAAVLTGYLAGVLKLGTAAISDVAVVEDSIKWFNGANNPVFEAYIKTPNDINENDDVVVSVGVSDSPASHANYAYFTTSGLNWSIACGLSGGSSDSDSDVAACAPNTWYRLRIAMTGDDSVSFYVNETLVGTLDGANAVPKISSKLGRFVKMLCDDGGSTNALYVDWVDLRLTRAGLGEAG